LSKNKNQLIITNFKKKKSMKKKMSKQNINVVLAAIAIAMGATVVTLSIVDENVKTETLIRMLGIAAVALGIFALNKEDKESNDTE